MKLKVGQFARLKSGYICKIININDFREPNMEYGVEANYLKDVMFIGDDDVVKGSYNIIDLIEIGDYVNSYKIGYIDDCKGAMREFYYDYENPNDDVGHWQEEIKTIITHEQMEQMAYKVGE